VTPFRKRPRHWALIKNQVTLFRKCPVYCVSIKMQVFFRKFPLDCVSINVQVTLFGVYSIGF
jgi:hypothetical protein